MNNFDNDLSSLLGIPLDNKVDTINYCDYIFAKKHDSRIVLDGGAKSLNNSAVIPLSSNLSWKIEKQPHMLLAGVTGSGKTTFINYLILEMKKMQAEVYVCDPKRSDLGSLRHVLGDEFVATDVNNIAKLTRIVKETMEQRFIDYKENAEKFVYGNNFFQYGLKPIFIVFDELGAYRAGADKKIFTETMSNLTEVILKGREMGVFCVLATQQPNANNIPTELRDNLSVRIALGNMSSEAYRMVFGEDVKDLQSISAVGTGYIYLDGLGWSKPKLFQAPFLDYKNFNFVEELKKY
jgi:DNA segregation ATPase FtsK/SpoIIIE-like protein